MEKEIRELEIRNIVTIEDKEMLKIALDGIKHKKQRQYVRWGEYYLYFNEL